MHRIILGSATTSGDSGRMARQRSWSGDSRLPSSKKGHSVAPGNLEPRLLLARTHPRLLVPIGSFPPRYRFGLAESRLHDGLAIRRLPWLESACATSLAT